MPDSIYPGHLVPQTNYLALDCGPFISEGFLVRCLKEPAKVDPSGMLHEESFKFPQTSHWLTHFSVSLLGNYKVHDAIWQFALDTNQPRHKQFDTDWIPGKKGLRPKTSELIIPTEWGYFFMPLSALHEQDFTVGIEVYTCFVVHRPTKRNYWHFELHFRNQAGEDLKDLISKNLLTKGKIRSIVTGVRAKIISVVQFKYTEFQGWPRTWYSKPTLWQRLYMLFFKS